MKKYTKTALVRCTEDELNKIHKKAEVANLSLSRFFVKSALSDGQVLTAEEKEEFKQLRFEVRKVGINLNQIAQILHLNIRGNVGSVTNEEIENIVAAINDVMSKLLKKL